MALSLADQKIRAEIARTQADTNYRLEQIRHQTMQNVVAQRELSDLYASNTANRVYNFIGAVTDVSCLQAQTYLSAWSRENDDPITIILNSPGGGVFAGLALIDTLDDIKRRGVDLSIIVRGYAASMGGIILQSGNERVMGANSYLMIHEVSSGAHGKLSELSDSLEFSKRLADRCAGILASRSTLTVDEVKARWERRDWWLSAAEAVELGFADRIES